MVKPKDGFGKANMVRLWVHESLRVFGDRLVDDSDREWFLQHLNGMVREAWRLEVTAYHTYYQPARSTDVFYWVRSKAIETADAAVADRAADRKFVFTQPSSSGLDPLRHQAVRGLQAPGHRGRGVHHHRTAPEAVFRRLHRAPRSGQQGWCPPPFPLLLPSAFSPSAVSGSLGWVVFKTLSSTKRAPKDTAVLIYRRVFGGVSC